MASVLVAATVMTGCGTKIYDMTDEEQQLIVNYSAYALSKHNIYQPDGMTANIWKQYVNSPRSFAELRRAIMEVSGLTWQYHLKNMVHYCSSSILAGERHFVREAPHKFLTLLCVPAGLLLSIITKRKANV